MQIFEYISNNYYYYYYSLRVFHINISWWSFAEVWVTASLLKSRGLFSILAKLNYAVVWMVSTHPLISKSSSPCINPFVTVPRAPITIGITVAFMFHSFFQFSEKIKVPISLFIFFQFYSVVCQDSQVYNSVSSLSFVDYYKV